MRKTKTLCELWIKPNNIDQGINIIKLLIRMGYNIICIEASNDIFLELKKQAEKLNMQLLKRITVTSTTDSEGKIKLRGIRTKHHIVSFNPTGISAARLAARDTRIDTILFTLHSCTYIDKTQLRMMVKNNKTLEIPLKEVVDNIHNYKFVSKLKKTLKVAEKLGLNIVVSSASETVFELWHPIHKISILRLLGLSKAKSLSTVINIPYALISKVLK